MRSLVLASVLCLCACAPDPVLGSFTFTLTGTDTETAPRNQTTPSTGTGTLAITTGKKTDYVVTVAQSDTTPCVLEAEKNDKGDVINIAAGQTCTFTYGTGSVTATMTSGTLKADEKGENATLAVGYSYAGTTFGISFAGTGVRSYAGPRR